MAGLRNQVRAVWRDPDSCRVLCADRRLRSYSSGRITVTIVVKFFIWRGRLIGWYIWRLGWIVWRRGIFIGREFNANIHLIQGSHVSNCILILAFIIHP
jgi:hypothetical protein